MRTIEELIAQAITYDLDRDRWFDLASPANIAAAYNGIGPEYLPDGVRDGITDLFSRYEAAAVIHDWDYQHSTDRSRAGFDAANTRFHRNCLAIDAHEGVESREPDLLAFAVRRGGWDAWVNADDAYSLT